MNAVWSLSWLITELFSNNSLWMKRRHPNCQGIHKFKPSTMKKKTTPKTMIRLNDQRFILMMVFLRIVLCINIQPRQKTKWYQEELCVNRRICQLYSWINGISRLSAWFWSIAILSLQQMLSLIPYFYLPNLESCLRLTLIRNVCLEPTQNSHW